MAKNPSEQLAEFYEQYPACFAISKSPLFMRVLRCFSLSPRSFTELISDNKPVSSEDIVEIVSVLRQSGLVEKIKNPEKEIFRATDLAFKFIEKLDNTAQFYE